MAGNFNLDDYVQVNERIELFYKKYPEGSIQTEIVSNVDGQVIIKAYAYRNQDDKRPATGHAMEKEGSTYINKTSHIENCETSAVGRALAMLGFEIKKSVASREEVENVVHQQEQMLKRINELQAKAITDRLDKLSKKDYVLQFYKLDKVEDMTLDIFSKVNDWCNKQEAKTKGAA